MPEDTTERLAHTAVWLKQEAEKLRLLRTSIREDMALGNLPATFPDCLDACAFIAGVEPLTAAMMRLSKTIAAAHGKPRQR